MDEKAEKGGFTHTRLSESNDRKATSDSVESKHHFRDVISGQDIPKRNNTFNNSSLGIK